MSQEPDNQFAQSTSTDGQFNVALGSVAKGIDEQLTAPADLVVVFVAGYSNEELDEHWGKLQSILGARHVIGVSCQGTIGGAEEFEDGSSISVWAAVLPNATLIPSHLRYHPEIDGGSFSGWNDELTDHSLTNGWPSSNLLTFCDPFSFPMDVFLDRLNNDHPNANVIGGVASAAGSPKGNRMLFGDSVVEDGAVTIRISGPIRQRIVVSQGCRPIGKPMVITKAERNVVQELGGKAAFGVLEALFQTLPTREKKMVQQGLQLGRVLNEYQEKFEYGDFLIRNVIGVDPEENTLSIGDYVRPGQTVQFHIRDHESATAELEQLLAKAKHDSAHRAALVFTCNGRGLNLFPEPHHDASAFAHMLGNEGKVAGFFAAGEFGPVGGKNFVHGFTASSILFG